jgi:hypothetical protein
MQEVLGSDDKSQSSYVSPPIGILTIQILRCHNLIIGDITTSDPFVEIHYGDEIFTTPVIYKTLNPDWGDEICFDLLIYDLEEVVLKLIVFDHDFSQEADFLGSLEVKLKRDQMMRLHQKKEFFTKNLTDGENGTIQYALSYTSLSSALKRTEVSQPQDLLFNLPDDLFQSDVFVSSALASTDGSDSTSFPFSAAQLSPPSAVNDRGLCGVVLLSDIELDLTSATNHTHQNSSSSSTQSSNSFYVSITYHDSKKLTGIEKGQKREGSPNQVSVSLPGVFPFVILQQEGTTPLSSTSGKASLTATGHTKVELLDHLTVKVTCKNKFGGKTASEIYLSVSSFLKRSNRNQYETSKELKKNIEIGHLYSGQLTAKIQFIPILRDPSSSSLSNNNQELK